MSRSIF